MEMKENVRSLRAYFLLVGLFTGYQHGYLFTRSQGNIVLLILALLGLGFAIAYFCIGVALRRLLRWSPKTIQGVIVASMGFLILIFMLSLLGGGKGTMAIQLIFGLLITWYLLTNVKRLSEEEKSKQTP